MAKRLNPYIQVSPRFYLYEFEAVLAALKKHYELNHCSGMTRHQTKPPDGFLVRGPFVGNVWSTLEALVRLTVIEQVADAVATSLMQGRGGEGRSATFGSTNGMAFRADTKPAIVPTRLMYLSAFMASRSRVNASQFPPHPNHREQRRPAADKKRGDPQVPFHLLLK
jgi:hypothetical protein